MAKRHFKLNTAKDVSMFYDGATKTRIVKNEAVSMDRKKAKNSKRVALALQQGHIIEINEDEALEMQKAFNDAHTATPDQTKKAKAQNAKAEKVAKRVDPSDDEDQEEEEDDTEYQEEDTDDEDEEEEEDDEFEGMTKSQLKDAINALDPEPTAEEALTLKNAKVNELKDFLRKRKEEDED